MMCLLPLQYQDIRIDRRNIPTAEKDEMFTGKYLQATVTLCCHGLTNQNI